MFKGRTSAGGTYPPKDTGTGPIAPVPEINVVPLGHTTLSTVTPPMLARVVTLAGGEGGNDDDTAAATTAANDDRGNGAGGSAGARQSLLGVGDLGAHI